ncbi:LNS2-domain-containing protein [Rhizoclosmatium globosum]|uniref:LNS2-domain-containing protein n=1 Tax=Rhizoclosmatium globosum TaxID=329046 RepID=A0A1Y2B2E0_9FUNG|nr:LNS2-domain-containing protein [Rhizoclosmatium globosum]|eukprot:ORY28904.1 LNS2-domain-containing protein [Rhizoclosmatium globosum]
MKVGEAGEAFFVVEMDRDDPAPSEYATSPIMKGSTAFPAGAGPVDAFELPDRTKDSLTNKPLEDQVMAININDSTDAKDLSNSTNPQPHPVGSPGWQWNWGGLPKKKDGEKQSNDFSSETEARMRVNDNEVEKTNPAEGLVHEKIPIPFDNCLVAWRTKCLMNSPVQAGMGPAVTIDEKVDNYLSSLTDQMASPDKPPSLRASSPSLISNMESRMSTTPYVPPSSPISPIASDVVSTGPLGLLSGPTSALPPMELSLCGKPALALALYYASQPQTTQPIVSTVAAPPTSPVSPKISLPTSIVQPTTPAQTASPTVTTSTAPTQETPDALFSKHQITSDTFSTHFTNPNLVVRIQGHYYDPSVVLPVLTSIAAFGKGLPEDQVRALVTASGLNEKVIAEAGAAAEATKKAAAAAAASSTGGFMRGWFSRSTPVATPTTPVPAPREIERRPPSELDAASQQSLDEERERNTLPTRYVKSLRMSSDQLKGLNLQPGVNTISFTVTSRLQGLQLARHDTRVVISDVDGTITKSDVLGHVWTHSGVASLYTNIHKNGYQILYLTSRAIGQANYTRDYLKKVEQGKFQLPEGPIVMRPEEFKISCLRDIKRLFGPNASPFYAGFGNRITDVQSYRAVEIPLSRIFTIDPSGEVKLEFTKNYKSSYDKLNEIADHVFPPVTKETSGVVEEQEFWKVWRTHLPEAVSDMNTQAKIESGVEVTGEESGEVGSGVEELKEKKAGIEITANESGQIEEYEEYEVEEDEDEDLEEEALLRMQASEDEAAIRAQMAEVKQTRY